MKVSYKREDHYLFTLKKEKENVYIMSIAIAVFPFILLFIFLIAAILSADLN